MNREIYQEPLVSRYTSKAMQELFSEQFKFSHWRKCWIALAEAQHELGLTAVTAEMIAELNSHAADINFEVAVAKEKEIRHDVMAHVFAYGQQCPLAEPIIHLGATSQFVVCNTDLTVQKQALKLVKKSLLKVIQNLAAFSGQYKDMATLGFTHYQAAQPTTIGKRNTLYIQDLIMDFEYVEHLEQQIKARGAKGTVGTQATFIELFGGDHAKVRELDRRVAEKLGFDATFSVTGQTYPRKLDMKISETLAGIAASAHKFGVDLRLLSNLKMQEEPFASKQVGSSAMAYKRNPMRSERMTGLARKLMGLPANFAATAANQWFERTLDDSAIRRMDLAQAFLLADAILKLYINISSDMVVYPNQVERYLREELPFMATEKILMACVERGESRQEMHEIIRDHSVAAGAAVKNHGLVNDLLERLGRDDRVPFDQGELDGLLGNYQEFTGRASEQTQEYLQEVVTPLLEANKDDLEEIDSTLTV
ncbi:adenylosuccinate lyase [Desulfogranum mediterraneum]|uniref:adenylosuccinate lyase n=1 Tax=Desulfogranum mediterraneum TaxID=160661 RepID=UPI0004255FBE|nr:adenylosuccinate lyase [Desulfogranum mediterraneum]